MTKTPIMDLKEIGFWKHFIYENSLWIRISMYAAINIKDGNHEYFGWKTEDGYEEGFEIEFERFMLHATKVDSNKLSWLAVENKDNLS